MRLDKLVGMADKGLMTLEEAAAHLGVAKITLHRWTTSGQLICVRVESRRDRRFRKTVDNLCFGEISWTIQIHFGSSTQIKTSQMVRKLKALYRER